MKILQICKKIPYPAKDGESIAILNLLRSFKQAGNEITVLAMNTLKHYSNIDDFPAEIKELADFHSVTINTNIKISEALFNLFTHKSYNIERFISEYFSKKIVEILNNHQFDIIQLEGLYLAPYVKVIRKNCSTPISMRAHNVEFEIWERLKSNTKWGIKRSYIALLAKRLKKYEINVMNDFDVMIPITQRDANRFKTLGCSLPMHVTPTGVDFSQIKADLSNKERNSVFFLGALDWLPNKEGVNWLLKEVWHLVTKENSNVKLYIAGRNIPEDFRNINYKQVEVVGEVESAYNFMNSKQIMLVPLFSGSGMRIKIVEGLALGNVIISTSIGAEGINYTDGKNILIADNAQKFAEKILQCLNNENLCNQISNNALNLAKSEYDNEKFSASLLAFYQKQFKL